MVSHNKNSVHYKLRHKDDITDIIILEILEKGLDNCFDKLGFLPYNVYGDHNEIIDSSICYFYGDEDNNEHNLIIVPKIDESGCIKFKFLEEIIGHEKVYLDADDGPYYGKTTKRKRIDHSSDELDEKLSEKLLNFIEYGHTRGMIFLHLNNTGILKDMSNLIKEIRKDDRPPQIKLGYYIRDKRLQYFFSELIKVDIFY